MTKFDMSRLPMLIAVSGTLDPFLLTFVRSLMPPDERPDLQNAVSIVRDADGLIVDHGKAIELIFEGVYWAVMSSEFERQRAEARRTAREINGKRMGQLQQMKSLRDELEHDRIATMNRERYDLLSVGEPLDDRLDYKVATKWLDDAISALDTFIQNQRKTLRDRGGNKNAFETAFVWTIRSAWFQLSGKSSGTLRTPVVEFAVAVWQAFKFPQDSERPIYDVFAERFRRIC